MTLFFVDRPPFFLSLSCRISSVAVSANGLSRNLTTRRPIEPGR